MNSLVFVDKEIQDKSLEKTKFKNFKKNKEFVILPLLLDVDHDER